MRQTTRLSLLLALTPLCAPASQAEQGASASITDAATLSVAQGEKAEIPPAAPSPLRREPSLEHPASAIRDRREGTVDMDIAISETGSVENIIAVKENPPGYGFADAAAEAVAQWPFNPEQPGTYRLTVRFKLKPEHFDIASLRTAPAPIHAAHRPIYPRSEFKNGVEGKAELIIHIASSGQPQAVVLLDKLTTNPSFGRAAKEAVRIWWYPEEARNQSFKVRIDFTRDALAKGLIAPPD